MGPFYKKRGYASSQLEMRRESHNQTMTNNFSGLNTSQNLGPKAATVNNQIALIQNQERSATLYTGQRDLGNLGSGTFHIEIFLNKRGDLIVTAQHMQRLEISFVIEIASEKLPQLLPEFSNVGQGQQQYAYMADHLKIMNSRMVLLNPVSFITTIDVIYRNSPREPTIYLDLALTVNFPSLTVVVKRISTDQTHSNR